MDGSKSEGAIADLWTSSLPAVTGILGRMSYLCSLRDRRSGRYWQAELEQTVGGAEADRLLRTAHRTQFSDWLRLTLRQQMADLDALLPPAGTARRSLLAEWVRTAPYRDFVPAGVEECERLLFLCDMEAITSVLFREYAVELPGKQLRAVRQ